MSDMETLRKALPAFMQHVEEEFKELDYYRSGESEVDSLQEDIELLKAENKMLKAQLAELVRDKEYGEVL